MICTLLCIDALIVTNQHKSNEREQLFLYLSNSKTRYYYLFIAGFILCIYVYAYHNTWLLAIGYIPIENLIVFFEFNINHFSFKKYFIKRIKCKLWSLKMNFKSTWIWIQHSFNENQSMNDRSMVGCSSSNRTGFSSWIKKLKMHFKLKESM